MPGWLLRWLMATFYGMASAGTGVAGSLMHSECLYVCLGGGEQGTGKRLHDSRNSSQQDKDMWVALLVSTPSTANSAAAAAAAMFM